MIPSTRPRLPEGRLRALVSSKIPNIPDLTVVGIRGYYLNTMGVPRKNDINIYDDAIILLTPNVYATYNGNVDPSKKGIRMAWLCPGVYKDAYILGKHRGLYEALVQRGGPVTVYRPKTLDDIEDLDENDFTLETGYFGINIHKGGLSSTNSLGCQTIHPSQWNGFMYNCTTEAKRIYGDHYYKKARFTYILFRSQEI